MRRTRPGSPTTSLHQMCRWYRHQQVAGAVGRGQARAAASEGWCGRRWRCRSRPPATARSAPLSISSPMSAPIAVTTRPSAASDSRSVVAPGFRRRLHERVQRDHLTPRSPISAGITTDAGGRTRVRCGSRGRRSRRYRANPEASEMSRPRSRGWDRTRHDLGWPRGGTPRVSRRRRPPFRSGIDTKIPAARRTAR